MSFRSPIRPAQAICSQRRVQRTSSSHSLQRKRTLCLACRLLFLFSQSRAQLQLLAQDPRRRRALSRSQPPPRLRLPLLQISSRAQFAPAASTLRVFPFARALRTACCGCSSVSASLARNVSTRTHRERMSTSLWCVIRFSLPSPFAGAAAVPVLSHAQSCQNGDKCWARHDANFSLDQPLSAAPAPLQHNSEGLPIRPAAPICIIYLKHGECNVGKRCYRSHPERTPETIAWVSVWSLRSIHLAQASRQCLNFHTSTGCPNGDACKYRHDRAPPSTQAPPSQPRSQAASSSSSGQPPAPPARNPRPIYAVSDSD